MQVVATATHANARSFYAFSRDKGMPDRGFFHKLARNQIPINAVWLVLFISGAFGSPFAEMRWEADFVTAGDSVDGPPGLCVVCRC